MLGELCFKKVLDVFLKVSSNNSFSHVLHEFHHVCYIMIGHQLCSCLFLTCQIVDMSSCVLFINHSSNSFVQRRKVVSILWLSKFQRTFCYKCCTKTCCSTWENTIKHVYSQSNADNEINWI